MILHDPLTPSLSSAEEVKKLKSRVATLESDSSASSAQTSRLFASANDVNTLQSGSYMDSGGYARADNGLNLGTNLDTGTGTNLGTGINGKVDNDALQRTIQQMMRAELQSQSFRGSAQV